MQDVLTSEKLSKQASTPRQEGRHAHTCRKLLALTALGIQPDLNTLAAAEPLDLD
jgi:hypothetical protein